VCKGCLNEVVWNIEFKWCGKEIKPFPIVKNLLWRVDPHLKHHGGECIKGS
jgi:hypothetical protein